MKKRPSWAGIYTIQNNLFVRSDRLCAPLCDGRHRSYLVTTLQVTSKVVLHLTTLPLITGFVCTVAAPL